MGALAERPPDDLLGQVLGGEGETLKMYLDGLRLAKRDPRIQHVLLMPSGISLEYWGKVQELRAAIQDFRSSGKKVVAFLEYGGDREYYLASAADQVFLLPTAPLDLTGVASYQLFLRGTLDKLGIEPDFLRIGEYKTAPNQLTERSMTPAHREMMESLTRSMYEQLVRGIAESRRKSEADVRQLIDQGPFTADEALAAGLVDDLAYEDQLDDLIPELAESLGEGRRVEARDYERVSPRAVGIRPSARIAVLYAVGTIVSGKSGFDPLNGAAIGSDTLVEQIRKIRADDSIDAVVLRVDSPGGSAVASDVIWRELMITREEDPSRPLVTSMSDLAASGGYYIGMAGESIVAQPGTLTGSIGIYGGKLALGGAAEKLGVDTDEVTVGANADLYSPFETFTPGQREKVFRFMESFYTTFVEKAASSRGMTPERIDAVAQGRVWTGEQAREHGLVDALGGLDTAVAVAKERAGIPADEDVELVMYPPRLTLYEALAQQMAGGGQANLWSVLAGPRTTALAAVAAPVRLFRSGEPLALMPSIGFR
jgi:protease-4